MTEYLVVEKTGPLTTVQDQGRRGQQHLGVSVGGCVDAHAASWANRLVWNEADDAVLELTLGQLSLRFGDYCTFAIAGADCQWRLDGQPLQNWSAHRAGPGSLLEASIARTGVRAYFAISGGIRTPQVWGSRSTSTGAGIGGVDPVVGRSLAAGDRLPVAHRAVEQLNATPAKYTRDYLDAVQLRLVPSNQFEQFTAAQRQTFFRQSYTVSPQADRMGVRLEGTPMAEVPGNLTSEAVAPGAVQVPSNGLPIVLMADCQTIGGYPKIGHVYRVDLDRLAQARPGTEVFFSQGTLAEAQAKLREQRIFFTGR